jgi:hypothetical protein
VVNDDTKKPPKDIDIDLRVDCQNPHRPKALEQKTDVSGTAVFHSVSLAGEPICIDLFSIAYAYAPLQLDYVFVSPDKAAQFQKSLNPIITALPAEVTFHVRKRGLGERLDFMFRGP